MKPNSILTSGVLAGLLGSVSAFNDQSELFPSFVSGSASGARHGQVFAANDANFDSSFLSEPLTEYIVGAPDDEGLLAALEAVAPSIPVGRAFTYRTHDTSDQYRSDSADDGDIREIGGDFAKVGTNKHTQVDGRTDNKGLTMVLDNDQGGEDPQVQQRAVSNLRNRLLRSDLRRVFNVLDANDTNTAKTWASGTVDPDLDVTNQVDLSGDARGVDANIIVWGKSAWIKRLTGHRGNANAGGFASASMTPQQAATMCGAENGIVLPFRYQSAVSTKSKIVGDTVWIYHVKRGAMPNDPSNIKRFVTNTPSGLVRVYITPELKKTLVTVEHYSRVVGTSTLGIRSLTIS